jgi:hypothetical protein
MKPECTKYKPQTNSAESNPEASNHNGLVIQNPNRYAPFSMPFKRRIHSEGPATASWESRRRTHAGAAAGRCYPPASASSTGWRKRGHSGHSGRHLPIQSAWNAWLHAGSARTAGSEPEGFAPAGSSERHTAQSCDGAGNGESASAACLVYVRRRHRR